MKTKIKAEIVAHSVNEQGDELISVLATFPRIILAEVNTHRMLSKNTSSSRAIPFAKMVETIQNDPFIPIAWQKAHKGMQGTEYFTDETIQINDEVPHSLVKDYLVHNHLLARDYAVSQAKINSSLGATKQICNRYLEPFMWTTMLITGPKSGWDNFFKLRCPSYDASLHSVFVHSDNESRIYKSKKDMCKHFGEIQRTEIQWLKINKGQAEIHIMELAECIWDAYNESTPKVLKAGEWHIPFWKQIPFIPGTEGLEANTLKTVKISVAMAARTSYTVVGEEKGIDIEAMVGLHDRLLAQDPPHSSPLEHCAKCMDNAEYYTFNKGQATDCDDTGEGLLFEGHSQGWCNNLKGFIPYRYMVDNGSKETTD